jgi:hypothetical protein
MASAVPPKADMYSAKGHVCFGPKADMPPKVIRLCFADASLAEAFANKFTT